MLSAQRSHGGIVEAAKAKAKAKAAVGDVLRRFRGMVISGTTPMWWLVQERDGRRTAVLLGWRWRGGEEGSGSIGKHAMALSGRQRRKRKG